MMLRHRAETLSEILSAGGQLDTSLRSDLFSSSFSAAKSSFECYQSPIPDGLYVPQVIIPEAGDLEDLFATVATYYPDQSPLTALAHVLTPEFAKTVMRAQKALSDSDREHHERYRRAMIGAALGEAALSTLVAQEGRGGPPSYAAMRRTLAFALARGHQLYGEQMSARQMASKWTRLREITGLPHSKSTAKVAVLAHETASGITIHQRTKTLDEKADFYRAVHSFVAGHDLDGDDLNSAIAACYPNTKNLLRELSGAFDGRIRTFTQLIEIIQIHSQDPEVDEIAVGYLCNKILPSSFAHASALMSLAPFFPTSLVWYGFFSLLTKPAKSSSLSSGLLLKIERDIVEPFSLELRPRCDISLEELEVLSRGTMRSDSIRPTQQRTLLVSLLPGVNVYTRFGNDTDTGAERVKHDSMESTLHRRVASLLQEALGLISPPSASPNTKEPSPTSLRRDKKRIR